MNKITSDLDLYNSGIRFLLNQIMKSLQEENIQKIFLLSQYLQYNHTVKYVARASSPLFKHQLVSRQNFETVKDFRYY